MSAPNSSVALEILERLVAYESVSDSSNLDCVAYIEDYLRSHGVEAKKIFNEDKTKANILATIGPASRPGVVLSGHTDVVPADHQIWTSSPWALRRQDGRLYGRGTVDMKGFVATVLATVPEMVNAELTAPIHIALSYDEELGQRGVPSLIKALCEQVAPPKAVIVGEATAMKPVFGHKGNLSFFTNVKGRSYHSSRMDIGVSAVHVACRLVSWLDERMKANRDAQTENGFTPGYTTLHCGKISGGHASNIIADECSFVTEIRSIPQDDPEVYEAEYRAFIEREILPEIQAIAPDSGVTLVRRAMVPGLRPDPGGAAELLVRDITGYSGPPLCVTYGTEGGQFQQAGWSSIVCGPGDIAQAHQADEYLEESEFERCLEFMQTLVGRHK